MAKKDPYVRVKDTPTVREFFARCRDCGREFIERPGDGCDGYCPICNYEADQALSGRSY